jgi:dolichol-phosphate mannosyltransferase
MTSNDVSSKTKPIACIVMPTYNEAKNIEVIIPKIFQNSNHIRSHRLKILVVDDSSPDGTAECVKDLQDRFKDLHIISGEKKGLGDAYKRGFAHAINLFKPDLIIQMDADGQHSPELIPVFISLANWGFSFIIGSRFAPGGETINFSLWRKFLSYSGNWLIRFLGGIPRIHDCTSGYRCIKTHLIQSCNFDFLSTRGYSFQSSLLCELLRNKAKVIEVPIIFHDRLYGDSKLTYRDQIEFLFNIAKIRFRRSQEFVKFCCVGFSGLIINMGIYIALTRQMGLDAFISSPIAIEISILSNFYLNHIWTFNKRDNSTPLFSKLIKFHFVAGVAGITNYVTFITLLTVFGIFDILANFIGILSGTIINYALNSIWTWKQIHAK